MKIKIKNFVFAGFAAAMFAGHAMAAGDTIVTSKAYVDQKLGLKANTADLAAVATSGSYTDLTNTPSIPAAQVNADWDATSGVAQILNKPTLSAVATSGSYNDLTNKPTIPTVPTNVSAFTNDAGYATTSQLPTIDTELSPVSTNPVQNKVVTSAIATANTNIQNLQRDKQNNIDADNKLSYQYVDGLATVAHSGSYNDLTNKPTIPTAVSDLANDSGFITSSDVPAQVNADWNATSGAGEILNKPTTLAGYGITDAATSAQGALADTAVQPGDLATVATSGSYNDLTNKPTIPAAQVQSDWNATTGMGAILNKPTLGSAAAADTTDFATAAQGALADTAVQPSDLATVATTGSYNDLSNKPTIPAAQVNADWNSTSGVSQILNKPTLSAVATSGSYNDLSNKPTLGTAAAAATTDFATAAQGALAASAVQPGDLAAVATSGAYSDLSGTPDLSGYQLIDNKVTGAVATWTEATKDTKYPTIGAIKYTQNANCDVDNPCAWINNQWVRIAQVGDQ